MCGYHNHIENSTYYAVVPYVNCSGCVYPGAFIDTLTKISSHELCEAITDPTLSTWWAPGPEGEIGDICNLDTIRIGGYLVQPMWSVYQNVCEIAPPAWSSTVGVYRGTQARFYLKNTNTTGPADINFVYGDPGDVPVVGDWTGKGYDSIGVYRPTESRFYVKNSNAPGPVDISLVLGNPGDGPIVGDWTGKGFDSIGVYRPKESRFYLKNSNVPGPVDISLVFGDPGDTPVVGRWLRATGHDTVGVRRQNQFYLANSISSPLSVITFFYGDAGDIPVTGRWTATAV